MDCETCSELIELYAADALEAGERAKVRAHLGGGCATCAGKLAEAEQVWGQIGLAPLAELELPTGVLEGAKNRLDAMISEEGVGEAEREGLRIGAGERVGVNGFEGGYAGTNGAVVRSEKVMRGGGSGGGRSGMGWILPAAVLVGGLTAGLMWTQVSDAHKEADGLRSEVAAVRGAKDEADAEVEKLKSTQDSAGEKLNAINEKLAIAEKRVEEISKELEASKAELVKLQAGPKDDGMVTALRAELATAQQTIEMLHSKNLLDIKLAGQPDAPGAAGRLLVDLDKKVWKLYTTGLVPIDGRVYEFWLITKDGVKVPMGSFTPGADGRSVIGAAVPDPLPVLASAAITDEIDGNVKVPGGKLRVAGDIR